VPRHPSSATFFSTRPVFGRIEFAQAFGRRPGDRAVTELLKYHVRVGNIRRIARGVFASVPKGIRPGTGTAVDRFLAASRLRIGAVVAYRSALELHGCAITPANEVQLIASGEPGLVETSDFTCRFVSRPSRHSAGDGVTTVDRQNLPVNVTTLERTLVDLFDRYDLAGGAEDLFRSLDIVVERETPFDIETLLDFAKRLGNATAVGALGYWLDGEQHLLGVPAAALEDLRSLAPRHVRYGLGASPGHGRAATGWNVILPAAIVERYFDD
jgi:predicted transcriptional regulator of viral defense system